MGTLNFKAVVMLETKLQKAFKNSGLTVSEITKRANISRLSWWRYIKDPTDKEYRVPDVRTAIQIAQALNTTVESIWGRQPLDTPV